MILDKVTTIASPSAQKIFQKNIWRQIYDKHRQLPADLFLKNKKVKEAPVLFIADVLDDGGDDGG